MPFSFQFFCAMMTLPVPTSGNWDTLCIHKQLGYSGFIDPLSSFLPAFFTFPCITLQLMNTERELCLPMKRALQQLCTQLTLINYIAWTHYSLTWGVSNVHCTNFSSIQLSSHVPVSVISHPFKHLLQGWSRTHFAHTQETTSSVHMYLESCLHIKQYISFLTHCRIVHAISYEMVLVCLLWEVTDTSYYSPEFRPVFKYTRLFAYICKLCVYSTEQYTLNFQSITKE